MVLNLKTYPPSDSVPDSRDHKIIADSSRPETISFIKGKGFIIRPCTKKSNTQGGYVRDGIEHIRKFEKIFIHPRCKNVINEFQHYSYKKDRNGNILPELEDRFNHTIDALRYALEDKIRGAINWVRVVG